MPPPPRGPGFTSEERLCKLNRLRQENRRGLRREKGIFSAARTRTSQASCAKRFCLIHDLRPASPSLLCRQLGLAPQVATTPGDSRQENPGQGPGGCSDTTAEIQDGVSSSTRGYLTDHRVCTRKLAAAGPPGRAPPRGQAHGVVPSLRPKPAKAFPPPARKASQQRPAGQRKTCCPSRNFFQPPRLPIPGHAGPRPSRISAPKCRLAVNLATSGSICSESPGRRLELDSRSIPPLW